VDGIDAAEKTTLADELAALVPDAARLSADDFLHPAGERYRRGRESPEGYYLDSFDHARLRRAVAAAPGEILLVDGIFLLRPELEGLWNFRIFVDVRLEEALRRGLAPRRRRSGAALPDALPTRPAHLSGDGPTAVARRGDRRQQRRRPPDAQPGRGARPSVKNG